MNPIEVPLIGAKWTIGLFGLSHTMVASLAIGMAFFVTVAQIVGYRARDRRYDLIAKKVQLIHVCIYNIGTILAIGLVFALSGLYPQFWSQIYVHFFWTLIVEEFIFFLLATTLTFHYFFWDHMWGHKKLHILLGALLTPTFLLQFYLINGLGGFMLTPGFQESQVSMSTGILGWDRAAFYNPSFLMLTLHRAFANIAYGGFAIAGFCGGAHYLSNRVRMKDFYETSGQLAFVVGFSALLSLPIIGYFYAHVLKLHANESYVNLMWGRGDIVAGGIDWWWLKHMIVAFMLGGSINYFRLISRSKEAVPILSVMVYALGSFYVMFYLAMGMIMTWAFFWWMLAAGVTGGLVVAHCLRTGKGSARSVYLLLGILSMLTVLLGGYSREAARPRFVDRISHYDSIYVPTERQPYLMVDVDPSEIPPALVGPPSVRSIEVVLIHERCSGCHTLERVRKYQLNDWELIINQMRAYGLRLTDNEAKMVADYLMSKWPY